MQTVLRIHLYSKEVAIDNLNDKWRDLSDFSHEIRLTYRQEKNKVLDFSYNEVYSDILKMCTITYMQRTLRRIALFICWAAGAVAGAVALFLLAAFVLSSVPVQRSFAQGPQEQVEIFVTSNGVHTDIVVPVATTYIDWREKVPLHHFALADSSYSYLAFGWGDRRFYMETPSWRDLTPGIAVRAALWPTPAAMHVAYISSRLLPTQHQQPVLLSQEQYRELVRYIDGSFQKENGSYRHISGSGYTGQDTFYEAHGRFYILKNCNNWVNQGLKAAGVETALWAPLPFAVMRHLR